MHAYIGHEWSSCGELGEERRGEREVGMIVCMCVHVKNVHEQKCGIYGVGDSGQCSV